MKLYERIENNNFEEINKDRAIELIKNGNGHLVYNQSYFDLQKDNEELKSKNKTLEELLQGNLYELYKYYKDLAAKYQGNCIPIQKVKDKIEELKHEKKRYGNCLIEIYENELINRDIQVLQELIKEEEENHEENI